MSSSITSTAGHVMVVTHGLPPSQQQQQQPQSVTHQRFNRVWPVALGTVQIFIGILMLMFGIAAAITTQGIVIYSGIFVWGAMLYIASGSLTVAAGKYGSRCQMSGSLVLNIFSAMVSVTGVILYSLDAVVWDYRNSYALFRGYSGILAIFQLLEVVVSITVASSVCYATCSCCTESVQPTVLVVPPAQPMPFVVYPGYNVAAVAPPQFPAPAPTMMSFPKNPEDGEGAIQPPAYDTPAWAAPQGATNGTHSMPL